MSLIGQKTATSSMNWDDFKSLIGKLERDSEFKFCLLIAIGVFTGLRISDLLQLRFSQFENIEILTVQEKKTKKIRRIKINNDLNSIKALQEKVNPEGLKLEVISRWIWLSGSTFTVKETLKSLNFRYSPDKKSWYWRSEADRSSNEKPIPLEMIREKFGSQQVALR